MNSLLPSPSIALLEPSFADALSAIEKAENLDGSLKQHWSCSLRQIAKALGRPVETIPARWISVRLQISALHHAMAGSRKKPCRTTSPMYAARWFGLQASTKFRPEACRCGPNGLHCDKESASEVTPLGCPG